MQNLAEFKRTMDSFAMAIKSGYGDAYQYATLVANNNASCWALVQMIRFNDYDTFSKLWFDLMNRRIDSKCSPDELMQAIAYDIIEHALTNHPILCQK